MLEIAEARWKRSMIFCTQYEPEGWHERINPDPDSESPISEAIVDWIIHNSFIMPIDGKIYMRERYGVSSEIEPWRWKHLDCAGYYRANPENNSQVWIIKSCGSVCCCCIGQTLWWLICCVMPLHFDTAIYERQKFGFPGSCLCNRQRVWAVGTVYKIRWVLLRECLTYKGLLPLA